MVIYMYSLILTCMALNSVRSDFGVGCNVFFLAECCLFLYHV